MNHPGVPDDKLTTNNVDFEQLVDQNYPIELLLNTNLILKLLKHLFSLVLSISNGITSFDFVIFPYFPVILP